MPACVIKLFGDPVIEVDDKPIEITDTLFSLLILLLLWHTRTSIPMREVVERLHPDGENAMAPPTSSRRGSRAEPPGPTAIRKRKSKLFQTLGLELPKNASPLLNGGNALPQGEKASPRRESLLAAVQAIKAQAQVDLLSFDEKIDSSDSAAVRAALELRQRGPLLAGQARPPLEQILGIVEDEAASREKKYRIALRRMIEEDRSNHPQQALQYLELLLGTEGISQREKDWGLRQQQELKSTPAPPPALPLVQSLPELVGRTAEVNAIRHQLQTPGLVTLTGTGGIGKTRLALAVAAREKPAPHFLIDFTAVTEAALLPSVIGQGLGLSEVIGVSWHDSVLRFLQGKSTLLIWDNCEPVAEACASLAGAILRHCPAVRLLATSRERLGLPGERLYPVPLLSLPKSTDAHTPQVLRRYEATRLFEVRAKAAQPDFRVALENAPSVFHICHGLDGLPLAIELAAALVDERDPSWIAARLDQCFGLLVDGPRAGSLRHPSLRAAFDLSYGLLSRAEQKLFRHLGVFAGSFSLDAAQAVLGITSFEAPSSDSAGLLRQLVRKSLVVEEIRNAEENRNGEPRFRLLITVRQYAQDRLREREEEEAAQERHRRFYLQMAEEAAPHLRGPAPKAWLDRLEEEHDNLRAALTSYRESGTQGEQWLSLARQLWWFWWVRGHLREGHSHLAEALAKANGASEQTRAQAYEGIGNLSQHLGDYAAARTELINGLTLAQKIGQHRLTASLLGSLGNLAYNVGDYEEAQARHQTALDTFRDLNDDRGILISLLNLGNLVYERKNYPQAAALFQEGLDKSRQLGDERHIALSLHSLSEAARMMDELPRARLLLTESLKMFAAWEDLLSLAYILESFASLAAAEQQRRQALLIWGAAEALRERLNAPMVPSERRRYEQAVAEVFAMLGLELSTMVWAEGKALTWRQAVAYVQETSPA